MNAQQIKQELKSKNRKAYLLLSILDEISDFKHKATFAPKSIVNRVSSIFESTSTIINNLKLLKKLGITEFIHKHIIKERTNKPMVKYTVQLNPKFQSKSMYKKKLSSLNKIKQTNGSK